MMALDVVSSNPDTYSVVLDELPTEQSTGRLLLGGGQMVDVPVRFTPSGVGQADKHGATITFTCPEVTSFSCACKKKS